MGVLDAQGPVAAAERLILLNATAIMLTVVLPVIAVMTVPAGTLVPDTDCPTTRPVVLAMAITLVLARPLIVNASVVIAPVIAELSVIVFVPVLIAVMKSPDGTLVPVTTWPTNNPDVLASVSVVLPLAFEPLVETVPSVASVVADA